MLLLLCIFRTYHLFSTLCCSAYIYQTYRHLLRTIALNPNLPTYLSIYLNSNYNFLPVIQSKVRCLWHPLLYDMFWNSGKQIRPRRLPVRSALLADNSRPPLGWLFYRSTYDYFACRAHFESDHSTSCSAALSQKGTCVQGLIINSCMRWSNNTTLGSSTSLLGTWHASNQARGSTRTHMIRWRETFIIYDAGKITLAEKERKKERMMWRISIYCDWHWQHSSSCPSQREYTCTWSYVWSVVASWWQIEYKSISTG